MVLREFIVYSTLVASTFASGCASTNRQTGAVDEVAQRYVVPARGNSRYSCICGCVVPDISGADTYFACGENDILEPEQPIEEDSIRISDGFMGLLSIIGVKPQETNPPQDLP